MILQTGLHCGWVEVTVSLQINRRIFRILFAAPSCAPSNNNIEEDQQNTLVSYMYIWCYNENEKAETDRTDILYNIFYEILATRYISLNMRKCNYNI